MTDSLITAIIAQTVCNKFSVTPAEVDRRTRHQPAARARQIIMKLLREQGFGVHYVAQVAQCDDTNVSYATNVIANRERADSAFEDLMQDLRSQITKTLQNID